MDRAKLEALEKEIAACALELDYEGIGRSGDCLREAVAPLLRLARAVIEVQRWDPGYDHYPDDANPDGAWVRYEDIEAALRADAAGAGEG